MKKLFQKLDILNSKNLFKTVDNKWFNSIPNRYKKGLSEIKPDFFYVQENKPIILFFEGDIKDKNTFTKIWNLGGVPIIYNINNGLIDIYNGFDFDKENENFKLINSSKESDNLDFSIWDILSGNIWNNKTFTKSSLVDEELLNNLKNTRDLLISDNYKLDNVSASNLIGRLLFSRYLVDREVQIDDTFKEYFTSKNAFSSLIKGNKDRLYEYFNYLKDTFNGGLFPISELEKEKVNNSHLEVLFDLFSGNKIGGNKTQLSLFNIYDFKIIPIELISEVYERFMGDKQKEDSAYYTPSFLVDYIVEKTVKKHLKNNNSCKVFDPSCGSGIFLVESLRQIIENNIDVLNKLSTKKKIEELSNIVRNNIYGVDKNEVAINITIFSLSLTLLDYINPKDITKFKFPVLKGKNLFVSDFFDLENDFNFKIKDLDFILGNPPWKSNKEEKHLKYIGNLIEKYNNKKVISDFQIAQTFILRMADMSTSDTEIALVLPSKNLYNYNAENFRNIWLNNFILKEILELSPVRRKIFSGAIAPSFIAFFKKENNFSKINNNIVKYQSIKPNIFLDKLKLLVIEKNDIKEVQQKYFIRDDYLWKILLYGNILDFGLIKRLKENYKNINDTIDGHKLLVGQGIQVGGGDKNNSKHLIGKKFLDTGSTKKALLRYLINDDGLEEFSRDFLHRVRDKKLFEKGSKILLKKGFIKETFGMVNCYTEEDYVFTHSVTAIVGNSKNKELLNSIVGLLNSNYGSYLLLLQGRSAGIEREQVDDKTDRFTYPIISNKNIAKYVNDISVIYKKLNFINFKKVELTKDNNILQISLNKEKALLENKLNKIILDSFNFSDLEKDLLDYSNNITIPLINNIDDVYRSIKDEKDLGDYLKIFLNYFGNIWNSNGKYFEIDIYLDKYLIGINFKVVKNDNKEKINFKKEKNKINELFNLIKLGENKITDVFYEQRFIRGFNENSFYIIKSNQLKNWHPAIAQADLLEFIDVLVKTEQKIL